MEICIECWDVELYTMSWHSWWASVTVAGTYVTDMVGDRHRIFIQGFYSWHTYLVSIATWRVHTMDRPLSFSCTTYVSRFSLCISHFSLEKKKKKISALHLFVASPCLCVCLQEGLSLSLLFLFTYAHPHTCAHTYAHACMHAHNTHT